MSGYPEAAVAVGPSRGGRPRRFSGGQLCRVGAGSYAVSAARRPDGGGSRFVHRADGPEIGHQYSLLRARAAPDGAVEWA